MKSVEEQRDENEQRIKSTFMQSTVYLSVLVM